MNPRPIQLLLLGGALFMGACSSTPARYHTLIPTQPDAAVRAAEAVDFQLQVQPVRIPVQVDQPSLVVRESDGRLAILETVLWASPPADEFHDALAIELENRLGVRDLAGLPGQQDKPLLNVRADVRRFDSLPGRHAALDVVWNLELNGGRDQRRMLTCATVIHEPAPDGIENLVLAHQRAIATLAEQIALTAQRWVADAASACP